MNKSILLVALLCIGAMANEVQVEDHVHVLTTAAFDDFVKQHEFVLVKFYAPWCGHCKKMAPEYSKAAEELKQEGSTAQLAKVDATIETELAQRFGVSGYPTIKFFVSGEPVEFNGGRNAAEIKAWVSKRTGAVSTLINNSEELTAFKTKNQVAVVYYGDSEQDSEWTSFKAVALENDAIAFAHVFDNAAKGGVSGHTVVLYKQFDEGQNNFEGSISTEALKTFINNNSFPLVMPFDDRAIGRVFQQSNPTIFLFHDSTDAAKDAIDAFQAAAKKLKGGKVLFSVSHKNDGLGLFDRLAEYVGASTTQTPNIMLVHSTQGGVSKFKFETSITVENIESFVNDFNNDKLQKYMKSEPIPESNNEPVKVIVGKSFDDIVLNSSQDVLVEFYAPWCGHCKALTPVYEAVAKAVADNKNLVIAKIDSTANEVPSVNISGFPTIKFYPSHNKKEPIDYDGARDEAGFLKWLEEKSTYEWVKPAPKNEDL